MNPSFFVRGICNTVYLRVPRCFSATSNSTLNFAPSHSFSTSTKADEETVCYVWGGGSNIFKPFVGSSEKQELEPVIFPAPIPEGTAALGASKPSPIIDISFGENHGMVLTKEGLVYTFGKGKNNELGLGKEQQEIQTPTQVTELSNIVQITAGKYHSMALSEDGEVFTWGAAGALGHPKESWWHLKQAPCAVPTKIKALPPVKSIASGDNHCIALTEEGEVFSWGSGEYGRLGHGGAASKTTPERITAFDGIPIKSIRCGSAFNGAVSKDNELWVWGRNDRGQCANAESLQVDIMRQESIPSKIDSFEDPSVISMDCGSQEMAAVTADNRLYQWGNGVWMEPNPVEGDNGTMLKIKVTDVAVGKGYSFALDNEGHIFSWGKGGHLGLGHKQAVKVPQAIVGFGSDGQDNLGKAVKIIAGTNPNSRVACIAVKV